MQMPRAKTVCVVFSSPEKISTSAFQPVSLVKFFSIVSPLGRRTRHFPEIHPLWYSRTLTLIGFRFRRHSSAKDSCRSLATVCARSMAVAIFRLINSSSALLATRVWLPGKPGFPESDNCKRAYASSTAFRSAGVRKAPDSSSGSSWLT